MPLLFHLVHPAGNLPESDALIPVTAEQAVEPELAVSTYVCKKKKKREKVSEEDISQGITIDTSKAVQRKRSNFKG